MDLETAWYAMRCWVEQRPRLMALFEIAYGLAVLYCIAVLASTVMFLASFIRI